MITVKGNLHWVIVIPCLLNKSRDHVDREIVDSYGEPSNSHYRKYTILYYLINIDTHLEKSNEYIAEIH